MFGLGLFYSVERGKCKEPVGLALCPRCHYSLNNGENECQIMGRRGEGRRLGDKAGGLGIKRQHVYNWVSPVAQW